jgi:DNA-binding transcriptional LysR family regulator
VLSSVRSGACEIGILGTPEPVRAPDLEVVSLESQALVLISGPDDDVVSGPTVRRDQLSGCRLIVSQRGGCAHWSTT